MHKTAFAAALGLVLFAAATFGQNIARGDVVIGGSASNLFSFAKRQTTTNGFDDADSQDTVTVSFNMFGGIFFADGLEIGPEFFVDFVDSDNDNYTDLGLGVQVGYYHDNGSSWVPYARFTASFVSSTQDTETGADRGETGFDLTPRIGIHYFLNDIAAVGMNGYFSYLRAMDRGQDPDLKIREFDFGAELGISLFLSPRGPLR